MAQMLVIAPFALELSALRDALIANGKVSNFNLQVGGHGKVQFALTTQFLIQKFTPDLVICAGAAGSLVPAQVRPLDVVLGRETVEHDFHLRFVERPLPSFAAESSLIEKLNGFVGNGFTLHTGTIASGDEDVISSARAQEIHARTGALAVAWEGAGAARACRMHKVPFVELRAVTDVSNASTADDFKQNVVQGMKNLAQVLAYFL